MLGYGGQGATQWVPVRCSGCRGRRGGRLDRQEQVGLAWRTLRHAVTCMAILLSTAEASLPPPLAYLSTWYRKAFLTQPVSLTYRYLRTSDLTACTTLPCPAPSLSSCNG